VDNSGGHKDAFRTPRRRLARMVGRELSEPLEVELESESSFCGVAGVMVVIVAGADKGPLPLGETDGDERVGNGHEGDDVRLGLVDELRRGMRGRGEPAVFELSEKRWSCD